MRFARLLVITALVAPIGVLAAQHASAAADTGTDCSGNTGTASFSNGGFPKVQTPYTDTESRERNVVITSSGTISGCVGGGVTGGTYTSTITTHDPSDCNELLSIGDTADPTPDAPFPSGTIDVTWNLSGGGTAASHSKIKIKPVSGSTTTVLIKTTGLTGQFAGLSGKQKISFAPNGHGDCSATDLTGVSTSAASSLEID
jgi:hypothetical protein